MSGYRDIPLFDTSPEGLEVPPPSRGDWMQTFTGAKFYPMDPRGDEVHIADVAHHLSLLCRYAGAVDRFYSVAEHSVKLSRWFLDQDPTLGWGSFSKRMRRRRAVLALLHDATEAYCVDVPRPLKVQLPAYEAAEAKIADAIWDRFDVQHMVRDGFTLPSVKLGDTRILLDERAALMSRTQHAWAIDGKFEPLGVQIESWVPWQAEAEFLQLAGELGVS